MPKVSIIIPMYNVENYIETCLDSVMNQTMKDYEVIVIDDGSVDHSYEKALEYQKRYPQQMQVFKQENAGQGAVRNNGVKKHPENTSYLLTVMIQYPNISQRGHIRRLPRVTLP